MRWPVAGLLVVLGVSAGILVGRRSVRPPDPVTIVRTDTLTIRDTVRLTEFREVEKKVTDTMLVVRTETVTVVVRDTAHIQVPRETLTIRDSLFSAQISGYKPSLDWIDLYAQSKVITVTETTYAPQSRWSFGVTAGPSAVLTPKGNLYGGLGVTAGVQYKF